MIKRGKQNIYFTVFGLLLLCLPMFGKGQSLSDVNLDSLQNVILTTSDDSVRGRAYNELAFHYLFSDVDQSFEFLKKGLHEADKFNLHFGKAELLNTKATYFDIAGLKDSAEFYFNKSLEISRKHRFKNVEVMSLNSLGLFYWKSGQLDSALANFYKALEINEESFQEDKESRSNYLSNIGLIYQELGQYNKAIEYHNQALAIRDELQLTNGQAISYANLGVCFENLKKYEQSEKFFLKAIQKAEAAKNWWMYYALHNNLGNTYNLTDKNEKAIAAYKKSLEKPENIVGNPKSELSVYSNLTSIYNKLNQAQLALEYAEKGFQILKEYPQFYNFSASLYFSSAESNYMLGNIDEGSKNMLEYRNVLDSTFSEKNAQALAEMKEKYESAKKDKVLLEQNQLIQQKEIALRQRTMWVFVFIALLIFVSGILFYLFKRKESLAKQTALELQLAEEKERRHIQEERLRISRDLHDNIGSYLTLINAYIEQIPEMSSVQLNEKLPELQKAISLSMRELRKTVWLLNNQEISIDAIALRLRDFFKPLNQNGTKITVKANGNTEHILTDIQATHLFRIIQEAVSNAYKHASAKNIHISLDIKEQVCFSIVDDGIGYDTSIVQNGNGLKNMKARIKELNGEISFKSEINSGTVVSACFKS